MQAVSKSISKFRPVRWGTELWRTAQQGTGTESVWWWRQGLTRDQSAKTIGELSSAQGPRAGRAEDSGYLGEERTPERRAVIAKALSQERVWSVRDTAR